MSATLRELDQHDRKKLVDDAGVPFPEFRKTLTPNFARVWFDIALGYLALAGVCLAVVVAHRRATQLWPLTIVLGSLLCGYFIAYLQLFFHEAAHFNLASSKSRNDVLANMFIGWMIGQDIKAYRVVHFDHHRHLGTPSDTERSYFNALTVRFMIEALTGIRIIKTLMLRARHVESKSASGVKQRSVTRLSMLLIGVALNGAIVGSAVWFRYYDLAVVWVAGMGVVHPFINVVRQVLEHRDFEACSSVDYASEPHGPMTRMFGDGIVASTLGGAGFNRHLLHHWEPQISYTRFAELEAYLHRTAVAGTLARHTVSYSTAFRNLLRAP